MRRARFRWSACWRCNERRDCATPRAAARQPPRQHHGPLQHPLLLLHAGAGRRLRRAPRDPELRRDRAVRAHARWDGNQQVCGSPEASRWCARTCPNWCGSWPPSTDRGPGADTNGILLPQLAEPLYQAGLRRLNVHLDTLDGERYRAHHAGATTSSPCWKGWRWRSASGFAPSKINAWP